jgi:hypothetical protein
MSSAIRLEDDSGEWVLDTLKFIADVVGRTKENRIGLVKTRTDEWMSNTHCQWVRQFDRQDKVWYGEARLVARLGDLVYILMEG